MEPESKEVPQRLRGKEQFAMSNNKVLDKGFGPGIQAGVGTVRNGGVPSQGYSPLVPGGGGVSKNRDVLLKPNAGRYKEAGMGLQNGLRGGGTSTCENAPVRAQILKGKPSEENATPLGTNANFYSLATN